jgi:hypothetical protein
MHVRHPARRRLSLFAAAATMAAAVLTLAASPASAATGPGASAAVSTWIADPDNALGRVGNAYDISVGGEVNPEGIALSGQIISYDCAPGQTTGCDQVAWHRLVAAGPVAVKVKEDGSATMTATVAETGARDARQIRVFKVNLTVTAGTLALAQNCKLCSFTDSAGNTYGQSKYVREWNNATASGTIGVFHVVAGAATTTSTTKYQVKSSVLEG